MSQENVDAVRSALAPLARGDFTLWSQAPDDFELVLAAEMPDAGTYRGEAARGWLEAWVESFERLTVETVEFIDAGDRVVARSLQRGWVRGSDTAVELPTWSVSTIRPGAAAEGVDPARLITRVELFLTRGEALKAAGLSESAMSQENVDLVRQALALRSSDG
jgi:ketosteroid isomerase-like protein